MDNETIEDIVSEMREYDNEPPPKRAWLDLADRIEAAWKRDKSDAIKTAMMCKCEICKEQGNAAAMREALCMIRLSLAGRKWFAPFLGMVDAALAPTEGDAE